MWLSLWLFFLSAYLSDWKKDETYHENQVIDMVMSFSIVSGLVCSASRREREKKTDNKLIVKFNL